MKYRVTTPIKVIGLVVLGLILVGISAAAMPRVKEWIKAEARDGAAAEKNTSSVALADGDPNTIRFVIRKANDTLGVQTGLVKKASPRILELNGSLGPDTDKLLPVRSRFPGESKIPDAPCRSPAAIPNRRRSTTSAPDNRLHSRIAKTPDSSRFAHRSEKPARSLQRLPG